MEVSRVYESNVLSVRPWAAGLSAIRDHVRPLCVVCVEISAQRSIANVKVLPIQGDDSTKAF